MTWWSVRLAAVTAAFLGGLLGRSDNLRTGYSAAQLAVTAFVFGVVGMLLVVGIQAFNARSAPVWAYPSWKANPFTMREPIQLFHLAGYFFLAAGVGALLRVAIDPTRPAAQPIVFASTGAGVICGVWLCCRVFHRKMART